VMLAVLLGARQRGNPMLPQPRRIESSAQIWLESIPVPL
jgi:hypothetical protein